METKELTRKEMRDAMQAQLEKENTNFSQRQDALEHFDILSIEMAHAVYTVFWGAREKKYSTH